jgi:hypothetical protein
MTVVCTPVQIQKEVPEVVELRKLDLAQQLVLGARAVKVIRLTLQEQIMCSVQEVVVVEDRVILE